VESNEPRELLKVIWKIGAFQITAFEMGIAEQPSERSPLNVIGVQQGSTWTEDLLQETSETVKALAHYEATKEQSQSIPTRSFVKDMEPALMIVFEGSSGWILDNSQTDFGEGYKAKTDEYCRHVRYGKHITKPLSESTDGRIHQKPKRKRKRVDKEIENASTKRIKVPDESVEYAVPVGGFNIADQDNANDDEDNVNEEADINTHQFCEIAFQELSSCKKFWNCSGNRVTNTTKKCSEGEEKTAEVIDIDSGVYFNTEAKLVSIDGKTTLLPGSCSVFRSDISRVGALEATGKYDIIVIDPPWPNISAERKGDYDTLDPFRLFEIPVNRMISPGSVVAWGLRLAGYVLFTILFLREFTYGCAYFDRVWTWLKLTCTGDWVIPFNRSNRHPYEVLLIGQAPMDEDDDDLPMIPHRKAIASVPSKYHSRKPFLDQVLGKYVKGDRKLELFARTATPGW
ncbi:Methyltransferase-like protein 4, partial [Blyttiomyces sp. JEL0837]